MLEEPMMQPGTFRTISETTTFYPFKPQQYLLAFEALFFIALTIITIAPDLVMMLSKFIVIVPDIIAVFTDPHIRIPFIIVACIMDIFCVYVLIVRAPIKFILSSDGIFYSNHLYRIYSSWENVIGFENVKYSMISLKGLKLDKEFQHGPTIEEGKQQGFPVFEYKNPAYAKRYPRKGAGLYFSVGPGANTFPLLGMSNKKRVKKKLISVICLYAPHVRTN